MKDFITNRKLFKKACITASAMLFWIAVWELASRLVAREMLLVSPVRTALRLFELSATVQFWASVLSTCLRVIAGFLMALVAGSILACITHLSHTAHSLLRPLLSVVRATPVASFIMLALIWISRDNLPTFIAFLMVTPLVWTNLSAGLSSLDRRLLEMAGLFKLSRSKKARFILIPGLMPYLAAACSAGVGYAWKSSIAAEIIALPAFSVGKQLNNARIYLETPDLFAWTVAVVLLSLLIEKGTLSAVNALQKHLIRPL